MLTTYITEESDAAYSNRCQPLIDQRPLGKAGALGAAPEAPSYGVEGPGDPRGGSIDKQGADTAAATGGWGSELPAFGNSPQTF